MASDAHDYLESIGIKYLCSDISDRSAFDVIGWILAHNAQPVGERLDKLTLVISSYGGIVDFSMAITDIMQGSVIPIHTVGLGVIASCGLMIFMAGQKGHRILTPNTSILSHQYSGGTGFEKEHELVAAKRSFDMTTQKMLAHYKKHTGLSEKKIRERLLPPGDVWLSAEEALELKLCDQIKLIG